VNKEEIKKVFAKDSMITRYFSFAQGLAVLTIFSVIILPFASWEVSVFVTEVIYGRDMLMNNSIMLMGFLFFALHIIFIFLWIRKIGPKEDNINLRNIFLIISIFLSFISGILFMIAPLLHEVAEAPYVILETSWGAFVAGFAAIIESSMLILIYINYSQYLKGIDISIKKSNFSISNQKTVSVEEELESINKLLEKGLINQEEFNRTKEEILIKHYK
jgi:hypothetical protein